MQTAPYTKVGHVSQGKRLRYNTLQGEKLG